MQQLAQMVNTREGGSGASGVGNYLLNRAKPHLPPWLGAAGVGAAGWLGNMRWEGSPGAAVGLTLTSVAVTGGAYVIGKSASKQRRLHSAITTAFGSAWLTAACLAGPAAGPVDDLYLMGGPALALSWNVRIFMRASDGGQASADGGLMEKIGLARAQIRAARAEPNRATARVELDAGTQTNDDMASALPRIASALDLPASAVRYQPDPDSARRGDLVIVPEDMLAETVEWEGPSNLGGSIADPLVIGRYDDGSPLLLWLPGDEKQGRNSTHVLIAGGTGSGKGDAALNLQTEILSRRDVTMVFSDPKSFQDFRPLLPGYDWAVEGGTPSEVMVAAVQAAVPARTRWLGQHRYRQWVPEAAREQRDPKHSCRPDGTACGCPGMPFMVAWFEEAANTLRFMGDDAFTGIAQEARSAGVSLVISLQRPSYDQMSTSTRSSMPSVIALGCHPDDEGFSLPDEVLAAGAHPGAWRNRKPGYCYVVSPGIDEDRYASPGRTWRFTPGAVETMELLALWAQRHGAAADPITAQALKSVAGAAYAGRPAPDTGASEPGTPVPAPAVPETDADDEGGLEVDPEDEGIDPEQELPAPQQGDDAPIFGQEAGRKPTPAEARRLFAQALDEFEAAGQMVVGPKDFYDWCAAHQLSRAWVSERLKEAYLDGRLAETGKTGRWRIIPRPEDGSPVALTAA
ncbi:sporulation protein SsgA [Streptomyces longispororuber]|uniref:Sporulation protein SsgA n=2 Tax=Streptomyces longispororuber TaxID=68230 RepID=A0A918ZQ06_9ACTN|nr:sporulation protein SsgA [Streptomyces longispororuber]